MATASLEMGIDIGYIDLVCQIGTPRAARPVPPGGSDLCFEWQGPIADAIAHLATHKVKIESGPMQRFGAKGPGMSVYFRDPDGSLLEFISYQEPAS